MLQAGIRFPEQIIGSGNLEHMNDPVPGAGEDLAALGIKGTAIEELLRQIQHSQFPAAGGIP